MEKSNEFKKYWITPMPSDKYPTLEMWHLSVYTDADAEKAMRLAQAEDASQIMMFFKDGYWNGYCMVSK